MVKSVSVIADTSEIDECSSYLSSLWRPWRLGGFWVSAFRFELVRPKISSIKYSSLCPLCLCGKVCMNTVALRFGFFFHPSCFPYSFFNLAPWRLGGLFPFPLSDFRFDFLGCSFYPGWPSANEFQPSVRKLKCVSHLKEKSYVSSCHLFANFGIFKKGWQKGTKRDKRWQKVTSRFRKKNPKRPIARRLGFWGFASGPLVFQIESSSSSSSSSNCL